MKISNDDLLSIEHTAIELFYQACKSHETKEKYTRTLKLVLCDIFEDVLDGNFEQRAAQFVNRGKKEPVWAMSLLLTLSKKLKERTEFSTIDKNYLNPSSFENYFKPLKKLLDMNEVPIIWKRVYATYPAPNNNTSGRSYTKKEIQKLLCFANGAIDRSIILVAASSGIREGGFDFSWDDIRPVYKIDNSLVLDITESQENATIACAYITIYKGSAEEYPAFITPEAYDALQDYKSVWIRDIGRMPKPKEPVFKKEGMFVMPMPPTAIKARIEKILKKSGIRKPLLKGKRRHEVPVMNGFRRFFNKANKDTASKESALSTLIKKEYMMGHTGLVSLDRNYYQSHILELAEEYLNAVPNLTISDELRTQYENTILKKEKSQLEKRQQENEDLRQGFEQIKLEMQRKDHYYQNLMDEVKNLKKKIGSA